MFFRLFLLFTLIPIAELALLIRIGGWLGLGPTLLLVVGTGAAGAWLARREGLRSWLAVQGELAQGKLPGESLVHAVLILVAGIVLLTPGVITDVAGILLLVPPVRKGLIARLRERFAGQIERGAIGVVGGSGAPFSGFQGVSFGVRPAGRRPARDSNAVDGLSGREIIVEEADLGEP